MLPLHSPPVALLHSLHHWRPHSWDDRSSFRTARCFPVVIMMILSISARENGMRAVKGILPSRSADSLSPVPGTWRYIWQTGVRKIVTELSDTRYAMPADAIVICRLKQTSGRTLWWQGPCRALFTRTQGSSPRRWWFGGESKEAVKTGNRASAASGGWRLLGRQRKWGMVSTCDLEAVAEGSNGGGEGSGGGQPPLHQGRHLQSPVSSSSTGAPGMAISS
jgi:hypothetical protein